MSRKLNFRPIHCLLVLVPAVVLLVSSIDVQNHFFQNAQGQPTVGTSGSENATDTISSEGAVPEIIIAIPSNNSQVPVGELLVSGNASDTETANIQTIGVKVDEGDYMPTTPQVPGDWSEWSVTTDIPSPGPHTLKARADYGAGDQTWSIGNVLVNANGDATSDATSNQSISGGSSSPPSTNEMSNESATVSPVVEIPPQPSQSQEEVQAAPSINETSNESATVSPVVETPPQPSQSQEEVQAAATYKNPIDILLGR